MLLCVKELCAKFGRAWKRGMNKYRKSSHLDVGARVLRGHEGLHRAEVVGVRVQGLEKEAN